MAGGAASAPRQRPVLRHACQIRRYGFHDATGPLRPHGRERRRRLLSLHHRGRLQLSVRRIHRLLILCCLALLVGCARPKTVEHTPPTTVVDPQVAAASRMVTRFPVRFTDVTASAGLTWRFTNGATGQRLFIEQTGGGVAFLDYNNDGLLDIFAVQGGPTPGDRDSNRRLNTRNVLYRNNGDGTFTDVTAGSGLDRDTGYGQGVSVADYDNDGWPDIFITSYGGNHLFHNNHDGTFTDVTQQAGLNALNPSGEPEWSTSSAWGDYDNDGRLDLFVCTYCRWSVAIDKSNLLRLQNGGNDSPAMFQSGVCRLYHNNGDGTFTDVTKRAGLSKLRGKSLAAAWIDYDDDGWMD